MKEEKILVFIAIVAVIISFIAAGITYLSIADLVSQISGKASTGEANLTVETLAQINFTVEQLSWGSGRVNSGVTAASLTTSNYTGIPNVTGGNWSFDSNPLAAGLQADGLRIENIGSVNVTINFTISQNASGLVTPFWIGGTGAIAEWNLTPVEANSCLNISGINGDIPNQVYKYWQANTTPIGRIGCASFGFTSGQDTLRLDFNLTIPEDSKTGALGAIITATATGL